MTVDPTSESSDDADRVRADLVVSYFADRDRGATRSDEEYRALYKGFEVVVDAELARLRRHLAEDPPAVAGGTELEQGRVRRFGRYRIDREIGRGGQGTVFLAFDTEIGRPVALKVLKPSWSGFTTMVRRFEREARALARLNHPGLATVHDVGSHHGLEYLVMPYVEGRTLARVLLDRGDAAPPDRARVLEAALLVAKAARALHVAHDAGLVHRDVKPANVMIARSGEPVVLDFGLAFFRDLESERLTVTGEILGTAPFMAPEQLAGDRSRIDRRTDVFALGATLRALVSWRGGIAPEAPRDLVAVLRAATDPDPDRRYATADALADDLVRAVERRPVLVSPPGVLRRFFVWCRRSPSAAAIAILPPVLLLAGIGVLAVRNAEIRAASVAVERSTSVATAATAAAESRFVDFQRLDDLHRVDDLTAREPTLWPAAQARLPVIERWIEDARRLIARLPAHRAALAALRASARGAQDGALGWTFPRVEDRWLGEQLAGLVARLEAIDAPTPHGATLAAAMRALEASRAIEDATVVAHAAAWREAIAAIEADARYGAPGLRPIPGLVPLGRDARSGLWEFAHWASGDVPTRGPDGNLEIRETTGIVLVLVPGGRVRIGARPPLDENEAPTEHVDPAAQPREGPIHEVSLSPFFMAKFEMTQAQWLRATGQNPSHGRPGQPWRGPNPSLRHPVEQVSFVECEEVLRRLGLVVPTEAQWERAARAGTTTPWWAGVATADFPAHENLCDRAWIAIEEVDYPHDSDRDDGWAGPAPVGSYRQNPFGLHDVIGNVSEWCRDPMAFYGEAAARDGDGERVRGMTGVRPVRGGAFNAPARNGRSSVRYGMNAASRNGAVGVRPALPVTP